MNPYALQSNPVLLLTGLAIAIAPSPALACPDGMVMQHVPGVSYCMPGPNYNPNPQQNAAEPATPEPPPPDPLANEANFMINFVRLQQLEMQRLQDTLNADPELNASFERQKKGEWKHFKAYAKAARGEGCAALYIKQGKAVAVLGPSADYKGALLAFFGPKLPAPNAPQQIAMTLEQTGEAPATVKVHNYRLAGSRMGAVAFAVPTLDAALSGMLDTHKFALVSQGTKLLEIEWTGGLAAAKRVKACAAGGDK